MNKRFAALLILVASAAPQAAQAGYPAEFEFGKEGCQFALAIENKKSIPGDEVENAPEAKVALNFRLFGLRAIGVGARWDPEYGNQALIKRVYFAEPFAVAQKAFAKRGYSLTSANAFKLEMEAREGLSMLSLHKVTTKGTDGNFGAAKSYVECENT